jgi:hypothetical protein
MQLLTSPRFLLAYCLTLTAAVFLMVLFLVRFVRNPHVGIVTARRINVVEPDGTVRLTISNRADFPSGWMRGKEYPRPDRTDAAGMLFMSEEGTEQGGLIWGAGQQPDGSIQNHGHLSLDQYEENQIFAIDAGREGNDKFSQITIADQGDYPVEDKRNAYARIMTLPAAQQDAAWSQYFAAHPALDTKRMVLGRASDGSVGIDLRDKNGKTRIQLRVMADGTPSLQFFDAAGNAISSSNPNRR